MVLNKLPAYELLSSCARLPLQQAPSLAYYVQEPAPISQAHDFHVYPLKPEMEKPEVPYQVFMSWTTWCITSRLGNEYL